MFSSVLGAVIALSLLLAGAVVTLHPPATRLGKRGWLTVFVSLGLASAVLTIITAQNRSKVEHALKSDVASMRRHVENFYPNSGATLKERVYTLSAELSRFYLLREGAPGRPTLLSVAVHGDPELRRFEEYQAESTRQYRLLYAPRVERVGRELAQRSIVINTDVTEFDYVLELAEELKEAAESL
jgi:hypothetical protein